MNGITHVWGELRQGLQHEPSTTSATFPGNPTLEIPAVFGLVLGILSEYQGRIRHTSSYQQRRKVWELLEAAVLGTVWPVYAERDRFEVVGSLDVGDASSLGGAEDVEGPRKPDAGTSAWAAYWLSK